MSKKMKGLRNFIYEIKRCKTPEEELSRVELELAKIRSAFENPKKLSGYDRKKYVNKLVMIYLLGHKIAAVGFSEALNLINSSKIGEKLTGYLYTSIVMLNSADLSSSVITCLKNDIHSGKELPMTIALNCLSTVAGKNLLGELQSTVANFLLLSEIPAITKKKAMLCMLKFFRLSPETFPHKLLGHELVATLDSSSDLGVLTSLVNLLRNVVPAAVDDYPGIVEAAVSRLHKLASMTLDPSYVFHLVPAPWLTVSLLKLLQVLPVPADHSVLGNAQTTLRALLDRSQLPPPERVGPNPFRGKLSYYHCSYAVLFEAAHCIAAYDTLSVSSRELQAYTSNVLIRMLTHNGPTTKWGVLDALHALGQTRCGTEVLEPHLNFFKDAKRAEANATVVQRFNDVLQLITDLDVNEQYVPVPASAAATYDAIAGKMDSLSTGGGAASAEGDDMSDEDGYFATEEVARHGSSSEED